MRDLVATAYTMSHQFGLMMDVAASTGARFSQFRRLRVEDLQMDPQPPAAPDAEERQGRPAVPRGKEKTALLDADHNGVGHQAAARGEGT